MARLTTVSALSTGKTQSVVMSDILSPLTRVEAPFIRVELGGYTFGVYEGTTTFSGVNGVVRTITAKYPNYVKSLLIKKINGQVNFYTLEILYPVTQDDDPNFFEKLFSSISTTRTISITYGDSLLPNYVYRDEEAIISTLTSSIDVKNSVLSYKVEAVSSAQVTLSGSYNFSTVTAKPSDEIKKLLTSGAYKLQDVFTGMSSIAKVNSANLIAGDDKVVKIPAQTGVSVLDRLNTLVSYMVPTDTSNNSGKTSGVYVLTTMDDSNGVYGGPYFKVSKVAYTASELDNLCSYKVDIGHPTANIVTEFNMVDNGGWALLYDYQSEIRANDTVKRIDSKGNLVDLYLPLIAGTTFDVYESDKTWWTKVTEYTTKAKIKIKGILKPSILMSYLKVNVWFYGRKHITSGWYLITSQVDTIDESGYWTELELLRVAGDNLTMIAQDSTTGLYNVY